MRIDASKPETMMMDGEVMRWTAINKDTGQEIPFALVADDVAGWVKHYKLDADGQPIVKNNEFETIKTIARIELIPHW